MEEKVKQLKQSTRKAGFLFMILYTLILVNWGSRVEEILQYYKVDASQFEVKLVEEAGNSFYQLYVLGEAKGAVDYNTYKKMTDKTGHVNYKIGEMIRLGTEIIAGGMLIVILAFGLFTIDHLVETFSSENRKRLKFMAVLTGLLAIVPRICNMILDQIFFGAIHSFTGSTGFSLFFLCLGVMIWILADFFRYGKELEEELDNVKKSYLDISV